VPEDHYGHAILRLTVMTRAGGASNNIIESVAVHVAGIADRETHFEGCCPADNDEALRAPRPRTENDIRKGGSH
jgi:hypothetical protein